MNGIKHPFSGALYEQDGTGNIRVTDGDKSGTFTILGRHLSGDLLECDPQVCGWVGGPQVANHRVSRADEGATFA